jgi:Mg2+/citrate symporter
VLGELVASDYLPYLGKLGIAKTFPWDAVTEPSGVPLPLKAGYTVNHVPVLIFCVIFILLLIAYRLGIKSRARGIKRLATLWAQRGR